MRFVGTIFQMVFNQRGSLRLINNQFHCYTPINPLKCLLPVRYMTRKPELM